MLDINFFKALSEEQLNLLQESLLNQICDKDKIFRQEWQTQNQCSCVKNIPKEQIINCTHVNKAFDEKIKYKKEKIREITLLLMLKSDLGSKLFDDFTNTIQI